MRNDVKLGFAIGGVLLAVLIVYVLVVPGGSSQPKKASSAQQNGTSSASATAAKNDAGKVTLEPVVPPPVPNTTTTQPSLPVVPPPAYANAGSRSKTTPAAVPAKTDPFASKSDDWNTILNQQPMLMTETPVAATGGNRTASPVAPTAAPAPEPKSPAASDSIASSSDAAPAASTQPTESGTPAVASSSSSGSSAGPHTHRIQAGETLSAISTAAYGSPAYYPAILRANPGLNPQHLKVGMTINLPDESAVKPAGAGVNGDAGSTAQHASAHIPGTAAPTVDSTKEYRVVAGDSLHKISIKLYGRSDQADKIYQLNRQTIGEDPHRLKIGQILKLPEPPTVASSR